jgi:hypothetical protein
LALTWCGIQLPLPGFPLDLPPNRDPVYELERIARDKLDLKHDIRVVLDRYGDANGIAPKRVNELVWGYVDDLISDMFYELEEELRDKIEVDMIREEDPRA